MITVTPLAEVRPRERRVAVGTFDGVHRGHRKVIEGADTVLTFDPPPVAIVAPDAAPKLLTTLGRKVELIGELGLEEMVVVAFDQAFAARSARSFIDDVLVSAIGATRVSVGENFRFGHKALGDAALLQADTRFETRVVPLLEVDGEIVSSSHVRGLILGGAVEYADRLLGRPFAIRGEVVHGDARGRELGYPTANLVPQDGLVVPGHGIYACRARTSHGVFDAAVNVGVRPTFETGRGELIEAFLIDFDHDIYGEPISLDFITRLRGERRFATAEALIEQMDRDVESTRRLLA